MKKTCIFMCMLMFLSSLVLAETDETSSKEGEQVKNRTDILGEEMEFEITDALKKIILKISEAKNKI